MGVEASGPREEPEGSAVAFDYDQTAPLDERVRATHVEAGVTREELHYASPRGGRVTATLLSPVAAAPPAMVFLHWGFGDRRSFLSEAMAYARAGAAALLVDAPGMGDRGRGMPPVGRADVARDFLVQCVTDVRRGLDLLVARGADPNRLAFVGHSLGATIGGPLAGVEGRLSAIVLMAGVGDVSTGGWSFRPGEAYSAALRPYDGVAHVGRSRAAIFFQFATRDVFVSAARARCYVAAAPASARVARYPTGHRLSPEALRDRGAWLAERLGLTIPSASWLDGVGLPRREVLRCQLQSPVYAAVSGAAACLETIARRAAPTPRRTPAPVRPEPSKPASNR